MGAVWTPEITKYLAAASLSILLYEYLTTLHAEVAHFWDRSWLGKISSTTVLFLLIRYCSLATVSVIAYYLRTCDLSAFACRRLYTAILFMWFVCIFVVQALQTLKLRYCLTVRLVRQLLLTFLAITTLSTAVLISFHLASPGAFSQPSTRSTCTSPYVSWMLFAPSYAFSLILLLWMMIVASTSETTISTPLLREFISQGSLVYSITFAIVSTSVGVLLAYASGDTDSASIGLPAVISISLTITSLAISRCLVEISTLLDSCASDRAQREEWIRELVQFKQANRNTQQTKLDGFPVSEDIAVATVGGGTGSPTLYSLVGTDDHDHEDAVLTYSGHPKSSSDATPGTSTKSTPGNSIKESTKDSDFSRASELTGLSYLRGVSLQVSARVYSFLLGYEPVKYQGN